VNGGFLNLERAQRVAPHASTDAIREASSSAIEVDGYPAEEARNSTELPTAQAVLYIAIRVVFEERQVVDVTRHQGLAAVKVLTAGPPVQVGVVHAIRT